MEQKFFNQTGYLEVALLFSTPNEASKIAIDSLQTSIEEYDIDNFYPNQIYIDGCEVHMLFDDEYGDLQGILGQFPDCHITEAKLFEQ